MRACRADGHATDACVDSRRPIPVNHALFPGSRRRRLGVLESREKNKRNNGAILPAAVMMPVVMVHAQEAGDISKTCTLSAG